jgi:hypothetical protein
VSELLHRLKVFVFRFEEQQPHYLLLKAQGRESCWGPIQGPLGFGEKLEGAIRREVYDDLGISRPEGLMDLQLPLRWRLGDEEVVEWVFGYRLRRDDPVKPAPRWADYRWAEFGRAYPALELESDRQAILRLHTLLSAA